MMELYVHLTHPQKPTDFEKQELTGEIRKPGTHAIPRMVLVS